MGRERSRTLNKAQPKTNYKEKYEHLIGKDAALDAAHSLKTDTDSKLYGMGVSAEQKKDKQEKEEREWAEKLERERSRTLNKSKPKTNYKEKYEHLIGKDAALDAA